MPYATHLPTIVPPWLARAVGAAYLSKLGALMDDVKARLVAAVKSRFPSFAADDALAAIGADRLLPQGLFETTLDYAQRLIDAWEIWAGDDTPLTGMGGGAGTHLGMLNALALLGLPTGASGMTLVQQNGRYSQLDGSGNLVLGSLMDCENRTDKLGNLPALPGWTFEARDTFYSEFGLIFPVDVALLTEGSDLATAVHDAIRKWKPGKMVFVGTWLIVTGVTLGWPTGRTLGTDPNLGGNVIRYIPPPGGNRIGYTP